jgi:CubicO group peptidase (beta-lactamase class C family)
VLGEVCFTGSHTVIAVALIEPAGGPDTSRMDQIVQSYVDAKQFMGSVLVARGDAILFNKSYGMANLEWNVPNTPTTKFRIGSITKQFTAAAILLLEERGKLTVEDSVKKYIPDAPEAWDKITLHNVLTHTGGIPNFTDFPDYPQKSLSPMTAEQIVAWFKDKPLDFDPGAKFSYSDSDYVLLGYLIEKLSGQTYEKFLQENILTPLGMKDSGYDSNTAIIEHRASGYSRTRAGPVNAGYVNMTVPHGAGGLYSTTLDLLKWEQGLFGRKLLKPESLAKMTTPFKENYAFGLIIQTTEGRKNISHNGGIQGFNASLGYYPDSKITVAVLSNLNGNAPDEMLPKLATVAHGQAVQLSSERNEIKLSRETLATYVGTYVADTIREFMRRGVIIKTVINGMTFDGSTTDAMQQAVRDALIAFMAATAQAQAKATKSAQRAGIDHKRRAQPSAYLGRKPSYDWATFDRIRLALDSARPPSLSAIAKAEGLSKQAVFRLQQDPQAALAALDAWGL